MSNGGYNGSAMTVETAEAQILPSHIHERVLKFLLDKRTGNLTLHIKDGRVLSLRQEEFVKARD